MPDCARILAKKEKGIFILNFGYRAILCDTVPHRAKLLPNVRIGTYVAQCSIVWHSMAQFSTMWHAMAQFSFPLGQISSKIYITKQLGQFYDMLEFYRRDLTYLT